MLRAIVLMLIVLPVRVAALSCLPWHVEDAFLEAAASADPYVIVAGRMDFAPEDLPRVDWNRQEDVPPETRVGARLTGTALDRRGAAVAFDEPIRLIVECSGPWCPNLQSGADYLAFVRLGENGHEIRTGACGGMVFQDPGEEMIGRARACLKGEDCTPPARRGFSTDDPADKPRP